MLLSYKRSQASVVFRVKILDSSATDGSGLTGLAYDTASLIISTIADNEATATAYTVTGSTIETISTLGTYAAPTATKCRFKEVDSTNHPGVYEIQLADARFAVASAKSLIVSISGATDCAETDVLIPLVDLDPYAAGVTVSDKTGFGLADDAITAAKFDESTAFPLKSADTGATQVARTGADSDTLETLSDEIALVSGTSGSGAITFTYTAYEDDGTTPLQSCAVWVTTDESGTTMAAGTLYTDVSGEVTFYLDAGTYYVWRQHPSWNFTNPDTETVA